MEKEGRIKGESGYILGVLGLLVLGVLGLLVLGVLGLLVLGVLGLLVFCSEVCVCHRVNILQSTDNHLRIDNKIEFQPKTRAGACSRDGGIDR